MRSIDIIKEEIVTDFMNNDLAAKAYGFDVGDAFDEHFSKVSVESILFYVIACAIWTLEGLFDAHRNEVESRIEELIPHRPKWYRDKALLFMKDKILLPDSDRYDTENMTEEEISAAMVVKHAVAVERSDTSLLIVKVAGESGGKRCKLDEETQVQLSAYFTEIKDAGVRISIVNSDPDTFNCSVDIYYNPMLTPDEVQTACTDAVKNYVENLPFNGEYTNMSLIDALQGVEGVKIAEFKSASYSVAESGIVSGIDARCTPQAGYFQTGTVTINMKPYDEQL